DRGRALARREALREQPGGGRGAARRGLPRLSHPQAGEAVRDQRQPLHHRRRADDRLPLGHEVPRDADHDRGPRARRFRHLPADHRRAAAAPAADSRHHRRGPPRPLRRAGAGGVLPGADRARTKGSRGLGLRGLSPPPQPVPGVGVLRGALGPRLHPRRVGAAERGQQADGLLPADDVQAHRSQPAVDRLAFRSDPSAVRRAGSSGVRTRARRSGAHRHRPPRGQVASETATMASLNALRVEAETWLEEVGRARSSAAPGVPDLAPVDAAHREVVSPETARAVGALLASRRAPEQELPRLRVLVRFLEDASLEAVSRRARQSLETSWWRSVPESGLEVSLAETEAALAWTEERSARLQREAAVDRGWESLLPAAQRVQAALAEGASALGAASVPALLDARRERDWPVLDTEAFLRATGDAYRDVLGWAGGEVAPRLGPPPRGDGTLADLDRVWALPGSGGVLEDAADSLRAWIGRLPDAEERARHLRPRTVPVPAAQV